MENPDVSNECGVAIQLNGVSIDVDVIYKDAIETNNNDEEFTITPDSQKVISSDVILNQKNEDEIIETVTKDDENESARINASFAEDKATDETKIVEFNSNEAKEECEKSPMKQSEKSPKKRLNRSKIDQNASKFDKFNSYMVNRTPRQRRYYLILPRGFNVKAPSDDCEIFCSNIPINVFESELVPLFERFGKIYELRLLMSQRNPNRNAGFAFIRYTTKNAAIEAIQKLDKYEIVPGKLLSLRLSQPNLSLFVGNIHRGLTSDQIHDKLSRRTDGLVRTFVKVSFYEETKNCGFCFLEYESHQAAINAKRLLNSGNVWGRHLFVDWAQRRTQPNDSVLRESKTVFVNYLPKEVTKEQLESIFSVFGTVESITKIKDYAFVLYTEHDDAAAAVNCFDKNQFGSENIEISLALPRAQKHTPSFMPTMRTRSRRNQQS